jgi:hypothetical protein
VRRSMAVPRCQALDSGETLDRSTQAIAAVGPKPASRGASCAASRPTPMPAASTAAVRQGRLRGPGRPLGSPAAPILC